MIEVSAPGKILISGEYAVLWGAPALCTTVDRRAYVSFEPRPQGWWIEAPQLSVSCELELEGGPGAGDPRLRLAEIVIGEAVAAAEGGSVPLVPQYIRIDTSEFFAEDGSKLGLGSSAAVATALWGGLRYSLLDRTPLERDPVVIEVIRLHRMAQGGQGSGVDVAASVHGGCIRFELMAGGWTVCLPPDVMIVPIWTGTSACTPEMIRRVVAATEAGGEASRAKQSLVGSARAVADALTQGAEPWLRAIEEFALILDELGKATGVPIVSDAHRRIADSVRKAGGLYKPSGAGGGDIGIAIIGDPDRRAAVVAAARASGGMALSIELGTFGLRGPRLSPP